MRHRIAGGQLNRTSAHRVALRRNLAASLFEHETISTTLPKAKHVKSFAEKLITLAKKGDLTSRRRAISMLGNRAIVEEVDGEVTKKGTVIGKLFSEIGPRYLDRAGGYTRIIKLAKTRLGDNSPLVLLQLVGQESKPEASGKSGKKKASKKKAAKNTKAEKKEDNQ
jgi:large subunit ribosomal protein L17